VSLRLWKALEEQSDRKLFAPTGGVDHGTGAARVISGVLSQLGLPFDRLSAASAEDRWPGMRFESEVIYQADAGRLHADEATLALQDLAESRGAELLFGQRARIVRVDGAGVVVASEAEEIAAPVVVVAAGAWTPKLLPSSIEIPQLRVTHEEPAYFRPRGVKVGWPVFVHWGEGVGATFGSYGMDVPGRGVKVGLHGSGLEIDPDSPERPRSSEVARHLAQYVESWLPGLDPSSTDTVSCIYDSTPDDDFVIDRTDGIVVATGFSGHGFKFGPAIGELIGRLACGQTASPARFRFRS
jgi:sarcosine oxidase